MQTDLQVLLLIVGIVFTFYVIFSILKRRSRKADAEEEFEQTVLERKQAVKEHDPLMDDQGHLVKKASLQTKKKIIDDSVLADEPSEQPSLNYPTSTAVHNFEQEMAVETHSEAGASYIAISVVAKSPNGFVGTALLNTLKANHFHFHKQGVFNRHINDNPSQPVMFSTLSLREPGIFDPSLMQTQNYEGILLLLVLPSSSNPSAIFEKMLTSARQLAVMLDGELCDAERKPLTAHVMARLREQIQVSHRRTLNQNNQQRA